MNYTILETEQTQGNFALELVKNGNSYTVGLYNTTNKEYTKRTFERLDTALACYTFMVCSLVYTYTTSLKQQLQEYTEQGE